MATTLISADFDIDEQGFVFRDDAFRDTNEPVYADGQRIPAGGFSGGALQVLLGGIDDDDITGMSGGWDREFTLTEPQQVTLTFRVKLTQASDYEPDEFSEALVSLDGTLLTANGGDFIARINGNGNGGGPRTTDWLEIEIDLGILDAGDHTLTFGGFNNKKTLANEETEILFDDIEVVADDPPPGPGEGTLIDADFDVGTDGFIFLDDSFRGTSQPAFADGQRTATGGFSGGGLSVTLGGIDDSDVNGMSGGWQTSFNLAEEAVVTISFRYNLTQASNYEANEFSQVLLSLDGNLVGTEGNDFIAQINGNGNGGPERSTGWQVVEINLGLLGPGNHDLIIGGFNNRKTLADEETTLLLDDVLVTELPPPPPGDVVLIQSDFDTDTGGFGFIDDAFRGTNEPDFADGVRLPNGGFSGGALQVLLGGIDDSDVTGMSGGWGQSFELTEETNVKLSFRYRLTQNANYENDEFSQVLVSLDGTLVGTNGNDFIAQITGNGNGGPDRVLGWQVVELDLGLLGPGTHELILGGFNNKKTLANEETEILFDDLLLTAEGPDVPVFELSSLDGADGFVLAGIDAADRSGFSVSGAGDVNGDGFEDVIVGASSAANGAGESYVVFGQASGFGSVLDLSALDGANGFLLNGINPGAQENISVSGAGDLNGDGVGDLIVGAAFAFSGGASYVVFGQASGFGSVVGLSSLDGSDGFVIPAIDALDQLGRSVSGAGDVNGDGLADLIIGASSARNGAPPLPGFPPPSAGESYLVFGRASGFGSSLDLKTLSEDQGFVIGGIDALNLIGDLSGVSVSGAGDVNGDGFADVIVGALGADGGPGNPTAYAGESYVVFGKASGFGTLLELSSLDGSNGFLLAGIDTLDNAGKSVSGAGDVNGDGFADLVIGAYRADGAPLDSAGESYVVFGKASGFGSVLELSSLDGSNGFVITGIEADDRSGYSVSGAGDVNGDGLDDLIVGTDGADGGPDNTPGGAGESYVIFGRTSGFGSVLDLSALTADQGFVIAGIDEDDQSGVSVSGAGDVNGDGFADLIVGASFADGGPDNAPVDAGESYVIFGGDFTGAVTQQGDDGNNSIAGGLGTDILLGGRGNDTLQDIVPGLGQSGPDDVLYGGEGDDRLRITNTGFLRVDGGTGTDTLVLNTPDPTVDLTAIADSKLTGIERIDLNADTDTLILSPLEVLNLSDSSNRLVVFGGAGDTVQASGEWTFQGFDTVDGVQVAKYASGAAQLWIQTGVAAALSATIELADLGGPDGPDGSVLAGLGNGDGLGFSVSHAGDFNGDGFGDLLLGAPFADTGAFESIPEGGESYVVFGTATGFASAIDVVGLLGLSDAILFSGPDDNDRSGRSVSGAGDVNGDGFADIIVGAADGDGGPDNTPEDAGESYVIFGSASGFGSVNSLGTLDGSNGFVIAGIDEDDDSGFSVSGAGDVNGDGFADLIVGARFADGGPDNAPVIAGESYVVFGRASGFGSALELSSLDGSNGFVLAGIDVSDFSGGSVSGAGDVNGDGFADLIVGAQGGNGGPDNRSGDAGESYVVFGRASGFGSVLELSSLDGANGFILAGIGGADFSGSAVSGAGDVNGDGLADLIVGAFGADGFAGESYVVFGRATGFGSVLELSSLDGANGFVLTGIDGGDFSGLSVSGAGDANGDGLDDLIVGARLADGGPENTPEDAGESYLIFGRATGFGSILDLETLTADQGFVLAGIDEDDRSGTSVSGAGDLNGDGFADLIVGAYDADGGPDNTPQDAGEAYVLFGGDFTGSVTQQGDDTANTLTGTGAVDVLLGAQGDDVLIGGGGPDVLYGGEGDDEIRISDDGFFRIDGGTGADTVVIDQPNTTIDLTQIADSKLTGIEQFDLNFDSNTLILSPLEVLNLSDNSNRLVVFGEPGDEVQASGDWVLEGSETIGADSFSRFVSGEAVLLIQDGVTQTLNFTVPPPTLDNLIAGNIDGFTGFRFTGENEDDQAGVSVSNAGDVNGDGFEDFIVGASDYDGNELGAAYVVFGGQDFAALDAADGSADGSLSLSNVGITLPAGIGGFRLVGEGVLDHAGTSVSAAGDVDGDGLGDLIVGSPDNSTDDSYAGAAYLVFGDAGLSGQLNLVNVGATGPGGIRGFQLNGEDEDDNAGDSVSSAGDVNGDGFADLIVGATGYSNDDQTGAAYIVFGGQDFADDGEFTLDAFEPSDSLTGFRLRGENEADSAGASVSSAGDVNGDGIDDLIVGAFEYPGGGSEAGAAYVIFGGQDFRALDIADGDDSDGLSLANVGATSPDGIAGFRLLGEAADDGAGISVSGAGDVNGDGIADLIIGAYGNDEAGNRAGAAYVVFGNASLPSGQFLLADVGATGLDGINGFRLGGELAGDQLGVSVSGAGDVNGDGFDDLIVGADEHPGDGNESGAVYVLFGGQDFSLGDFSASQIGGALDGFQLIGEAAEDDTGVSVSGAGDVNGDGIDDLLIGADDSAVAGGDAGAAYIVFGGDFSQAIQQLGDETANTLTGDGGANVLIGAQGDDVLDGNGGADVLYGGQGDDEIRISDDGFQRIDGGTGTDTLVIDQPNTTIDLTAIADGKLQGIEQVDLNFDSNTLILSPLEVLNLSDSSNRLVVFGEPGDEVQASGTWVQSPGFVSVSGEDFVRYTAGQAELLIQDGVTQTLTVVVAPPAPTIDGIADDTGASAVDGITSDDDLLVSGTAEPGTTVELFLDGATSLGTTVADGTTGAWSIQTGVIAEGAHILTATATNGSGLESAPSAGFAIEIDTTDPTAPSIDSIADDNGAAADDGITNDDDLLVSGTAIPGTTVELFLDGGTSLGTAVADATTGAWSVQTGVIAEGVHTLTAIATDAAGNASAVSTGFAIEIDTTAPAAPTIASIADDTDTPGDGITSDNTLLVSGTAVAGTTVELFLDGATSLGTTVADGTTGAWSIQTAAIATGVHSLTATASDTAGNESAASAGFPIEILPTFPVVELSSLDGANGFILPGLGFADFTGISVSGAGDVNGDGFEDVIVGALGADGGPGDPVTRAGESYVVFGQASGFAPVLNLSSLDGGNGFLLAGIDNPDQSGRTVSGAGDVNGDGFADVIVGTQFADGGPGDPVPFAGESYVVFGQASGFGSVLNLSSLNGSDGFLIAGTVANSETGFAVSGAGDVNGDGLADLIVGGPYSGDGRSYVVFGQASGFGSVLSVSSLDGANGFLLSENTGAAGFSDRLGGSVSDAGDVNGDGLGDVIVGAFAVNGQAGESYVVFGQASGFGSELALSSLDGSNGFILTGVDGGDYSGYSVSGAGDINGDGFADVIVGAFSADGGPGDPAISAGESYVVFGAASGFASEIALSSLDGSDGFLIAGDDGDDRASRVSGAGDVNGDGLDDLIIGAPYAAGGPDNTPNNAGESYVVFGRATGFGSLLDLDELSTGQGFLIAGIDENDGSGRSVSGAGDVNGDGFADLIVGTSGARGGPGNPTIQAGESYVIFGGDLTGSVTQQGDDTANTLTGTGGIDVLLGAQGNDTLFGGGGADVLYGGEGDDILEIDDATVARLKGGTGEDTLRLGGAGFSLDLTALSDLKIEEIEIVDLQNGSGTHTLTLDLQEVLNISDTSNTLTVLGDGSDTLTVGAGWTLSAGTPAGFDTYTQGAATLVVDEDITIVP